MLVHYHTPEGGALVSAFDSGSSSLGSSLSPGTLCCVLGQTHFAMYFHSVSLSLRPSGVGELNAGGNPVLGWHPIQALHYIK